MKTKFIALIAAMLACMVASVSTRAQQPQYVKPGNSAEQMVKRNAPGEYTYTYHVFEAPNKMFGYDIFLNGKIIFHQPASTDQPGISVALLAKNEHAAKGALMAIEKIKRGEPAALTQEEIKGIIVQ